MTGRGALALVWLAAVVAVLHSLSGCGASAVGTHARMAHTLAIAHVAAGEQIDRARTEALDRVEAAHAQEPTADQLGALDAEGARWRPVGLALDALRDALRTWTSSIALAHAAGGDASLLGPLSEIVGRSVALYERIASLARSLGVELPSLPPEVVALARALGGA